MKNLQNKFYRQYVLGKLAKLACSHRYLQICQNKIPLQLASQSLPNKPYWQYVVGKLAKPFLIDILSFVKTRISQMLSNKPDWQYVVGKVCHKVAVGAMSGCHKEKWNGMSSTVVA